MKSGCLMIVFLSLSQCARADSVQIEYKALEKAYHDEDRAQSHKNISGALADFSPAWYLTSPSGRTLTLSMLKQELMQTLPYQKQYLSRTSIVSLKLKNDTAEVTIKDNTVEVLDDPKTHGNLTIASTGTGIDTWKLLEKHWVRQKSKILSIQVKNNGKIIDTEP